ncbi:hypothetical protein SAMN05444266_11449 [Chitinophaga jiangningensis]|uniref:Uncharacterized protein n=1 Tax=Chitinophaga jiangningensis TaxID=1419482 RepID=A0A1M7MR74_9BACT|nr:hypothetical protein SAMN05444266_11449 [Chitinophaga jiangningensis]
MERMPLYVKTLAISQGFNVMPLLSLPNFPWIVGVEIISQQSVNPNANDRVNEVSNVMTHNLTFSG